LVRARVSLAEASHARQLSCEDVREELGEVAEGLRRSTAPARRHVRTCERCQGFKSQLRCTNRALSVVFPVAPLLLAKKVLLAHFGMTASAGASSAAGTAAAGVAATGGTSAMSAGISTVATKAAASLAAAAIVTAGAVEVKHVQTKSSARPAIAAAGPAPVAAATAPVGVASIDQPGTATEPAEDKTKDRAAKDEPDGAPTDVAATDAAARAEERAGSGLAPVQEKSQSVIVTGTAGAPKRTVYRPSPAAAPPESEPAAPAAPEPPAAAPEQQPAEAPSADPAADGGTNPQP